MSVRSFWIVVVIVLVGAAGYAGYFFWTQLRGAGPAFLPASDDIGELIESQQLTSNLGQTPFPLNLPDNMLISVFAENLRKPRVLLEDPAGMLVVSDPDAGKIIGLPDNDNDGRADLEINLVENLDRPHGLEFYCNDSGCFIYIAETNAVSRYEYDLKEKVASNPVKILDLPDEGIHWTRTLLIAETDQGKKLFTSIGSSCNACIEEDQRRATIMISDLDGENFRPYATGLRNSVFMTVNPRTNEIWATENGRDLIGDDIPPDEINIIKGGNDYGWPYCYGGNVQDLDFDDSFNTCFGKIGSHIDIQAHSAALGLAFVPDSGWPEAWSNDLIVAFHGSWNRTDPTGYKIVHLSLSPDDQLIGKEDLITGWLQDDGTSLGRPVALLLTNGGNMYLSDDKAGLIYRVQYTGSN